MWIRRCNTHGKWTIWVRDLEGVDTEIVENQVRRRSIAPSMVNEKEGYHFAEDEVRGVRKMSGQGAIGQL